MNVTKDPYEILGVDKNADMQEITSAYKRLTKKYHPDLNPNDYIAREAMKEINRAYEAIKTGNLADFDDCTQHYDNNQNNNKTENTDAKENFKDVSDEFISDEFVMYANINAKQNRLYSIFSLALFGGCSYFLFEYVVKYCTYDNLIKFFTTAFSSNSIFKSDSKRVAEFLPRVNAELYVAVLAKMFLACSVLLTAVLLLTAIYNIYYILAYKKIDKLSGGSLGLKNDIFQKMVKNVRIIKIVNIIYAVITYITLILIFASVMMYTVIQSAYFFPIEFSTYKILMIVISIIMFVVLAIFISEKCDRIKNNACLEIGCYTENLDTFIKGIGICLIPILIVIGIVMLLIYIVLSLVAAGGHDD